MLMFMIMIGTFLVNSMLAPVLFDSGASRLFVSRPSNRSFGMTLGEIEFFFRDSTLEIFEVSYSIDPIPISMRDMCMIVGMNWLIRFDARIVCEGYRVVVRTLSGGELIIYGESTRVGSSFCFVVRDR